MFRGLRRYYRLQDVVAETARLRPGRHASTAAVTTAHAPGSTRSEVLPSRRRPAGNKTPGASDQRPSRQHGSPGPDPAAFFKPSERVKEAFAGVNIGAPAELSRLPGAVAALAAHGIALRASKRHTWHPYDTTYLNSKGHPLREKHISHYLDKTDEPLWFYSIPVRDQIYKPVVINQCSAKTKKALRLALQAAGYDATGRRRGSASPAELPKKKGMAVKELFGTIRIDYMPCKVVQTSLQELIERLAALVPHLERMIGRD